MPTHRTLSIGDIELHVAEQGEGPLVLLVHGFPELWYSWRHQLGPLAEAGYRAMALDVRGYGQSSVPAPVGAYRMDALVGDILGLLDAENIPTATLVGHDWGANIVWAAAQLHPERFDAIVTMSIPYSPRPPEPPTVGLRKWAGDRLNWLLYFQEPGVAEAEFEADPEITFRKLLWALSGDAPDDLAIELLSRLPADSTLLDAIPMPDRLPDWLSDTDIGYYADAFARTGFTGALNRYRNVDDDWRALPTVGTTPVTAPTLFVAGELDTATRFRDWREPMRRNVAGMVDPVIVPGSGHWVQQERPEAVNAALVEFLRAAVPSGD